MTASFIIILTADVITGRALLMQNATPVFLSFVFLPRTILCQNCQCRVQCLEPAASRACSGPKRKQKHLI